MMEDTDTVGGGPLTQVTRDDLTVVSNNESEKDMKDNFEAEEKPKDTDPEPTEDEKASEASKELGKRGVEAAAKARAEKEEAEPQVEPEEKPEIR